MLEEILYLGHLLVIFGYFVPNIGSSVRELCQHTSSCRRYLQRGYLSTYVVDGADSQWRTLRHSIPIIVVAMAANAILSLVIDRVFSKSRGVLHKYIRLVFSVGLLTALHGFPACIVISLAVFGYWITSQVQSRFWKLFLLWSYALCVLLIKESYRWLSLFPFLQVFFDNRYGGLYNWVFPCNFLVLRMISCLSDQANGQVGTVSLLDYLGYVFYAPLYMAGPIISYQDFALSADGTNKGKDSPKPRGLFSLMCVLADI